MPKWKKSTAIIAVAQSTLSISESLERKYAVKLQWGDGIEEGSPGPSDKNDDAQEPPKGGFQGIRQPTQTPFLSPDPFQCWSGSKT